MTDTREALQTLLEKIYGERGFDFREYRESTLKRRLARRLRARDVETYAHYGEVLDRDPGEYGRLFNDLTINVSRFFRDEAAFTALKHRVVPKWIKGKTDRTLRIWSAGCASGEEPYSLMMLLAEALGPNIAQWDIEILCTDLDPEIIASAQAGLFTAKGIAGVPPSYLDRYFTADEGDFKLRPVLKQYLTFQVHDLHHGPRCMAQDMVICRNVLIYFTRPLQIRVIHRLHEALKPGGILMLGKAEVPVGKTKELFVCLDHKAKLYEKIESTNNFK